MATSIIRNFAIGTLLLGPISIAPASIDSPITSDFKSADAVYLVRVDSLVQQSPSDAPVVKFAVTETLRGKPVASLTLLQGIIDLRKSSEFLVLSNQASRSGQRGNMVGSEFKGNVGWHDAPVVREHDQVYVFAWRPEADKIINGQSYLTLDHVKDLLKQDADKSPTK